MIHKRYPGTVELLYLLEKYLETLAENMRHIFTQPFDVVHPNMGEYQLQLEVMTHNFKELIISSD